MQVSLASVAYPGPGQVVYRGVVVRGQEPRGQSFAEVGRADSIRLHRADRELTILLENPKLHAESPAQGLIFLICLSRAARLRFLELLLLLIGA